MPTCLSACGSRSEGARERFTQEGLRPVLSTLLDSPGLLLTCCISLHQQLRSHTSRHTSSAAMGIGGNDGGGSPPPRTASISGGLFGDETALAMTPPNQGDGR